MKINLGTRTRGSAAARSQEAKNSSTAIPAARIEARKVPVESSLCCGIESLARIPDFVMMR